MEQERSGQEVSLVQVDEQLFVYQCLLLASFVILYYDYILTFSDEYERYWARREKLTIATILFFLNRYLSIFGYLPFYIFYFRPTTSPHRLEVRVEFESSARNFSNQVKFFSRGKHNSDSSNLRIYSLGPLATANSCNRFNSYHAYLVVAIQTVVGSISILRTYALYGRSRRILILLGAVIAGVAAFGLWCVLSGTDTYTEADFPTKSCLLPLSNRISLKQLLGWAGLLAFEVLIFGLILYKSIRLSTKMNGTYAIIDIMLRDGAVYFGIIALTSVSVIVSFRLHKKYERGMTATLTNSLASSMISRLMLNLRDPSLSTGLGHRTGSRSVFSRLSFVVGFETSWTTQIDSMLPDGVDSYADATSTERSDRTRTPHTHIIP